MPPHLMFLMSAEDALARAGTTAAVTPTESPKLPLALCRTGCPGIELVNEALEAEVLRGDEVNGQDRRSCTLPVFGAGKASSRFGGRRTWQKALKYHNSSVGKRIFAETTSLESACKRCWQLPFC